MLYLCFLCFIDQILCAINMDQVKTKAFLFFYYADEMDDRIAVIELAFKTFTVGNVPDDNVETRFFAYFTLSGRSCQTLRPQPSLSECAY